MSKTSSALDPVPHPTRVMARSVMAQKRVRMRSTVLKGDFQNCFGLYVNVIEPNNGVYTHLSKGYQPDPNLNNHSRIYNNLQNVERQRRASFSQAEDYSRDGECGHGQVKKNIRPRMYEAISDAFGNLFSSESIM